MLKTLLIFLPLLPLSAAAECGFVRSDNTMTIVVGSKSNTCFTSDSFRDAFRANLAAAVEAMDAEDAPAIAPRRRAIDQRSPSAQKLWQLEERLHQARPPARGYFGQKR